MCFFFISVFAFHVLISRKDFQPMNFEECERGSGVHGAKYDYDRISEEAVTRYDFGAKEFLM